MKKLTLFLIATMLFLAACTTADTPIATTPAGGGTTATAPADTAGTGDVVDTGGHPILDAGNITLSFSWWGNDARADAMEASFRLFESYYPNVTIVSNTGPWDGWQQAILVNLSAGTEADILQVNYPWVHNFGQGSNVFLDLDTVSHILDLSEWSEEMLNFMRTADGQLSAVPHGMNGHFLMYNRAAINELGLDRFPETLEEFIEFGRELAADNVALDFAGENRYLAFIAAEVLDNILHNIIFNATGNTFFVGNELGFTFEDAVNAYELFVTMWEYNLIPTIQQDEGIPIQHNPAWLDGRALSAFIWVSTFFVVEDGYEGGPGTVDDLYVAVWPGPAGTPGVVLQRPTMGHAISANTQHPEAAAYFLNWFYTNEDAISAIGSVLGLPGANTASIVAEREGLISGNTLVGAEMLQNVRSGPIHHFFEDENFRQPRHIIMEQLALGIITATEAAQLLLDSQNEQLANIANN
ncbi:MAG: ABC transporter substrate-binding protein [Defluviitaleaceae bacterium]|nr:ABC transporter substrate-binding protein [Defluviitaleaceae bacterium]